MLLERYMFSRDVEIVKTTQPIEIDFGSWPWIVYCNLDDVKRTTNIWVEEIVTS